METVILEVLDSVVAVSSTYQTIRRLKVDITVQPHNGNYGRIRLWVEPAEI